MSLMIHTLCREGIVVVSDTRTTIRNADGSVRYDDTAEKIVPFPNNIVVSHCGDATVKKDLTVIQFLYNLRRRVGNKVTISDLPLEILMQYVKLQGTGDTTFLISGQDKLFCFCQTYKVKPKNKTVSLVHDSHDCGASYDGVPSIAHAIMNSGINYSSLSIAEAIDLTKLCLDTNLGVFKYKKEPVVGGRCQIYVIDTLHNQIGWFDSEGCIVEDINAPSDGLERYEEQRRQRMLKQLEKNIQRKKKG